jgi:hypothetical protein
MITFVASLATSSMVETPEPTKLSFERPLWLVPSSWIVRPTAGDIGTVVSVLNALSDVR